MEHASKMNAQDEDMVCMEVVETRRKWMSEVKRIFALADKDGSGHITEEELTEALQNPSAQVLLKKLGVEITPSHAGGLFDIVDFDESGAVYVDEFCEVLKELHGPAKSVEAARILYDTRFIRKQVLTIMETLLELSQ